MSGGNIKVVVRCRPLNTREIARGARGLVRMEGNQTILEPPDHAVSSSSKAVGKRLQAFSFDKSYWSAGPRDEAGYASQQTLYEDLGVELLDHSFEGFNTCIFAYGQTGSGKSYSMMGYGEDKGIIPLTTAELFRRVTLRTEQGDGRSFSVEVSYIEIYNEKVRDLLNPRNTGNLRVREHPSLGPYVEDLSKVVVEDYGQMMTLMDEGNQARTVASTNMNETSSRSHAVFTVTLTQRRTDPTTHMVGEKVSKISLVDLAGSERQSSTGATGQRLKEGANINRSLTTLGKVIAALAKASSSSSSSHGKKRKDDFVPYRDSVLTWLLKESLGGNSKTAMIAAISPADYEETLSTLRYADAAKKIKTHAVVNEDPNAKLIRELKEELELLRSRIPAGGPSIADPDAPSALHQDQQTITYTTKDGEVKSVTQSELQDQLQASEKLMESLNLTWEQKMTQTRDIQLEREKALEEMGITVDRDVVGVHAPRTHPSLVNLNEDPLMSECLVYQLKPGRTIAGSVEARTAQIKLSGPNIQPEHLLITNENGVVHVEARPDARVFVNGKRLEAAVPVQLHNGYRVILGDLHVFRFNDPEAVRAVRDERRKLQEAFKPTMGLSQGGEAGATGSEAGMDWTAARREAADLERMDDEDLETLYDNIVKLRNQRKREDSRTGLTEPSTPGYDTSDMLADPWDDPLARLARSSSGFDSLASPRSSVLESASVPRGLSRAASENPDGPSHQVVAPSEEDIAALSRPAAWTSRQRSLAERAAAHWRSVKRFEMAEKIMRAACDIREANIIARKLGHRVAYNFNVVDGHEVQPKSSLDDLNGSIEIEDGPSHTPDERKAQLVVKVVDREASAVYTWDWDRFTRQLAKMRHARSLAEKPEHAQHFRVGDAFNEQPPPAFSFVGSTKVPLRLLARHMSTDMVIPIMCPYTLRTLGSCRVRIDPQVTSVASGRTTPDSFWIDRESSLTPGSRLSFTVSVDSVKGPIGGDFGLIHAQTRLTSLVGPSIASEDTFASMPVDLQEGKVSTLSLRRSVTTIVDPYMGSYMLGSQATIEFFAMVRPAYLDRLERFDRSRADERASMVPRTSVTLAPEFSSPVKARVTVEIRELAADGTYIPADLIDNIFQLHQGLQRRIHLHVATDAATPRPWTGLNSVLLGNIRHIQTKAQSSSLLSPEQVQQPGASATPQTDTPDSKSVFEASWGWDTAAHDCALLDKRMTSDEQLLVSLRLQLDAESLAKPAAFSIELPIRIVGRNQKRSSFMSFWSSSKVSTSLIQDFRIDVAYPRPMTVTQLGHIDTSAIPLPDEELIGEFRVRGLDLLDDFERYRKVEAWAAEVQLTRAVLSPIVSSDRPEDMRRSDRDTEARNGLVRRCLALWQAALDDRPMKFDIAETDRAVAGAGHAHLGGHLDGLERPLMVPSVKRIDTL